MTANIVNGGSVPDVDLAYLHGDEVRSVSTSNLFRQCRAVVIGIPGAFTPVCTKRHIPDFIGSAEKLRASGYSELVCVASNDPFVVAAWAKEIDPDKKLRFLSDGNLHLARALGIVTEHKELFLGARSERYLMLVDYGVVKRLRVEPDILTYGCTAAVEVFEL